MSSSKKVIQINPDLFKMNKNKSPSEKKERLKDIFQGKVNLIISKSPTSRYFTYSSGFYHTEKRGNTTYDAWLN